MAKKFRNHRHAFRFQISGIDGKPQIITAWARIAQPTRGAKLTLRAADVEESMRLKGVGNTQTCSMAVCARRSADAFSHPVEGYIDWQYSRAYVVSKVKNGLPVECYAYFHCDNIAKLNDTRNGQKKLLAELREHGDRKISLSPSPIQKWPTPHPESGKKTGERTPRAHSSRGAKLRFAVAQLGGM